VWNRLQISEFVSLSPYNAKSHCLFVMSDTSSNSPETRSGFRPFAEILVSLRFLTRIPVPFINTLDPPSLARSMRFFGVAGAIIGALNGLILVAFSWLQLPSMMAAALTCGFGLILTGALHEDGLADSSDGLFGGRDQERRLLIMKDSRIGTYGASALILAILLRLSAYMTLLVLPGYIVIMLLAATGAFSRAMVVDMMWATKPARSDGLSTSVGRPSRNSALFAILTSGIFALYAGSLVFTDMGLLAVAAASLLTALLRRTAIRLIGGQTGDVCGAVQVIAELGMLVAIAARIG
jgi:adenosylcobinamide-GDP ribazoletransferase